MRGKGVKGEGNAELGMLKGDGRRWSNRRAPD